MPYPGITPCALCGKPVRLGIGDRHKRCSRARGVTHGVPNTYKRYGCRCDACVKAAYAVCAEFQRKYKERTGRVYRDNFADNYNRAWLPRNRRIEIYERDGWVCQLCFKPVDPGLDPKKDRMSASLDHIRPKSKGGGDELENLQLAHRSCNSSKRDTWAEAA
ncbi:HNH endonuclease [Nocardia terpenica]|uniref:HNH endonuclease n=1 Tax=Nocardia terpenica TaxID=455432 RepID=UPI00142DFACF|nr:HNH endonuclease signature motif containing protein [Nocardia terpenica]